MNNTPNSNRKHIAIFGNTNSGKSSLMNKILGQEMSLVSEVEGTTIRSSTKSNGAYSCRSCTFNRYSRA